MKSSSKKITTNQFVVFAIANLFLISCGTYQSAYTDDGIYGSSKVAQESKKIRIVGEEAYENNENEYFTKELERLDYANETAIFTDVDAYNSQDVAYEEDALNYNTNPAWGTNDNNNVVVRINLRNDSYWNDFGFNNFGWNNNRFNNFGWNNNRYNNWGYGNRWGWNNGFNNWGYNPFWNPYQNNIGFGWGYNNPYYGGSIHPYAAHHQYDNSYYRNTRNQRRASYNGNYRRSNGNARNTVVSLPSRRSTATSNAIRKFTSRRLKANTANGRASSVKATPSTRRRTSSTRSPSSSSSSTRRNSSSTRNPSSSYSSTRRNSSSTRNPSSSSSSSRRSSSSSRSNSRGSSSSSRSNSRGSSSSSRSSSRGSSSPSGSRRSN